ncbi:hypothetical protein SELMODRAFT_80512 [Selaginella moellendorffii]|uniref:G-patch domain-containing protein n=1 Tax=Selaginella moellendorffii TaxID=88036 RepID=D8QX10_SELML|nr:hypothetical protein SELMODRAFT_80512 [Selaginella moellendorffii]
MGRGDDDGSALVVYGTPLENSDELSARKRAKALDKGTLRQQQPVWKQDARDSEGRRRFHGAFTGGFSAGYFNTVGSKDGWEPKTFKSSRGSRADMRQHSAYDYMDDEERREMDSKQIGTAQEFDTFGFTAAEYARREATQETNRYASFLVIFPQDLRSRPAVIPGFVPDEIIVPPTDSIGVKLLRKMGWRHGRGIGPKHIAASSEVKREGRKAMLALASAGSSSQDAGPSLEDSETAEEQLDLPPTSVPDFVRKIKDNVHGLGFDPFQSAPEFRPVTMSKGFGIGALEEMGDEDEDVYATGPHPEMMVLEDEELERLEKIERKAPRPRLPTVAVGKDALPGFKLASENTYQAEWFHPPVVPPDYVPVHKFVAALDLSQSQSDNTPLEAPQPEDKTLVKLIDGMAILVARSGTQLEALSKEKNKENPLFQFLFGGMGGDYYTRRLWEERSKRGLQIQSNRDRPKLGASERGQALGEMPLQKSALPAIPAEDRARLQATLNNTFMKPSAEVGSMIVCFFTYFVVLQPTKTNRLPFEDDPAKQARYEQFLKDKYTGGLRKMNKGAQQLTEAQRAQEILEFEAVAHAARGTVSSSGANLLGKLAASSDRFTSGGVEQAGKFVSKCPSTSLSYPRRTEEPWRPLPLLCKRFDVLDPYTGQVRLKSLTLATPSESLFSSKITEAIGSAAKVEEVQRESTPPVDEGEQQEPEEKIAEKPVDLYKAIFSDDEEEEAPSQPVKNVDAANAALTRLVADDFLESLGKELGLAVPPPMPVPVKAPEDSSKGQTTQDTSGGQPEDISKGQTTEDTSSGQPQDIPKGHIKFVKPSRKGEEPKADIQKERDEKAQAKDAQYTSEPEDHATTKDDKDQRRSRDKRKDKSRDRREESSKERSKRKVRSFGISTKRATELRYALLQRRERKERHKRHKSKRRRTSSSTSSSSSSPSPSCS